MGQSTASSFAMITTAEGIQRVVPAIDPTKLLRPRFEKEEGTYRYNSVAAYLSAVASSWSYSDVVALRRPRTIDLSVHVVR